MTSRFGSLLRQLRREAGMTQERLAERAGVGVRSIRGFETGERTDPRVETVRLLADALELPPDRRDALIAAAVGTPAPEPVPEPASAVLGALVEAGDQLAQAVARRWQHEEEQRQVHDPFPLPVRWDLAEDRLMDHWANICRVPAGGSGAPLDLAGRLDEIVTVYRRIPSGRLVVLGRAGSGKTILTLRFVLDLLKTRTSADPVPVIFGIGSWDPTAMSLRDWLAGQLLRDHPGLAVTGADGVTLAAALVDADRILPILDGFDEIADGLHQAALRALNATTLPLVVTSRPGEYASAVAGTDVLTSAAAVELTDLTLADLADYLPRTTRDTVWDPVLAELRDHPDSPAAANLAAVLTTPLMVVLARTAYSDTPGNDPAVLLDTGRFATPEAIEDHLLGTFVPAVYGERAGENGRWGLDRVQHWLGYLAHHLDRLGTHDLAWWQVGDGMRRATSSVLIAALAALAVGGVDAVVGGLLDSTRYGWGRSVLLDVEDGLIVGPAAGFGFAIVHWYLARRGAIQPSRVHLRMARRGRGGRNLRRVSGKAALSLAGGVLFGLGYGLVDGAVNAALTGHSAWLWAGAVDAIIDGSVFGIGIGLVVALVTWAESPLDIRSAVSPMELLTENRTTVLLQLAVWGPVFGLTVGFGGALMVSLLGTSLGPLSWSFDSGLSWGLIGGIGGGIAYTLCLTAWGQWLALARFWLPLTGRLPWTVVAFLDDAYRRGVLRRAGATYQFRHARLQHHLNDRFLARTARPR